MRVGKTNIGTNW